MNAEELANYLINHDLEIQIIKGEGSVILAQLEAEGYTDVTEHEVWAAIELARWDPYIRGIAEGYYHKE